MCFVVAISVPKDQSALVESKLRGIGPLALRSSHGGLFSKRFHIEITEDGACGCSMMHDDDGPVPGLSRIRDDLLSRLVATVSAVAHVLPAGFEFTAMWIGDKPKTMRSVSLTELVETIAANQLRDDTRYVVAS